MQTSEGDRMPGGAWGCVGVYMLAGRVEPGGTKSGWVGRTSSVGGCRAGLRELVFYFSAWLGNLWLSLCLWDSSAGAAWSLLLLLLLLGTAYLVHPSTPTPSATANVGCQSRIGFLVVGVGLVCELSGAWDGHSPLCPLSCRGGMDAQLFDSLLRDTRAALAEVEPGPPSGVLSTQVDTSQAEDQTPLPSMEIRAPLMEVLPSVQPPIPPPPPHVPLIRRRWGHKEHLSDRASQVLHDKLVEQNARAMQDQLHVTALCFQGDIQHPPGVDMTTVKSTPPAP
eukprot:4996175-Amphidinium_carterae.1